MKTRSNLHTHSLYCDGKDSLTDMVETAIQCGFRSIGFSSHAYTGYAFDDCGIRKDKVEEYYREVTRLKEVYRGKITIFLGLELESRTEGEKRPEIDPRLDYTIGSCHLFRKDGHFWAVDNTPEEWLEARAAFPSTEALLENYFEETASFAEESAYDIIGHFDLVTKFNEKRGLFDEENPVYRKMALHYLERMAKTGKIFEVNTGAIARGWTTKPYPAPFLLKRLQELGAPVIISSDCHNRANLCCHFDETEKLLRDLGFKEQMELTEKGFTAVPL